MRRMSEPNRRKLTELIVRKAQPKPDSAYLIWDTHQRGLALRVRSSGRKVWMCIYRARGKPRWYHIGDAGVIGLADARTMAAEAMLAVAKGSDPAAERRAKRSSGSFGEMAGRYVEQYAKKHNKSWRQAERLVERYATKRWRDLPAASITRTDVRGVLAELKPILANQTLAAISAVFSWGKRNELVEQNPCQGIERNPTQSRERILAESEIPQVWDALDDLADPITASVLKTILLTGQRPGEVCGMRFEHIKDGTWWEMPGAPSDVWPGTKNGKPHRVALSAPVRALIDALVDDDERAKTGYVFEYETDRPVQRARLDKPMQDVITKLGIEPVKPHDLRRTAASVIASLGFGRQAIDRVLNHADRSIAAVYDRHSYSKEDRHIMEAVAAKIMGLIEGRTDEKVVSLHGREIRPA
jgi:integrase